MSAAPDPPTRPSRTQATKPYPDHWEQTADMRVFRASEHDWNKLTLWRDDMRRRGWRLLRITTVPGELVAVFGKTRSTLLP